MPLDLPHRFINTRFEKLSHVSHMRLIPWNELCSSLVWTLEAFAILRTHGES